MSSGTNILLATTDAGLDGDYELGSTTLYKEIPTVFFPSQWHRSFKYSRPLSKWLGENVAQFDVVHIHSVFNHSCIAAARACRKHRVPYLIRPLGTLDPWGMQQKPLRKKLFWHGGIKTMLANAAAIHYASHGEQRVVEESLGLKHGVVIPLGAEIENSEKSGADDPFIERFPALKDRPYVLVLSRLLQTKGLDVLLDAFLSLAKRSEFQEWRLVFAGNGPAAYVASLERTASQGAAGLVVFTGWLDGAIKKAALRNAALLALPSYHENFGLCVMEALACRVPVLVSPQVNLASEVESAGAGWIAPIEKQAIERALADAFSCPEERLKRGRAGKSLAQMYSWSRVATELQDLYASILAPASV